MSIEGSTKAGVNMRPNPSYRGTQAQSKPRHAGPKTTTMLALRPMYKVKLAKQNTRLRPVESSSAVVPRTQNSQARHRRRRQENQKQYSSPTSPRRMTWRTPLSPPLSPPAPRELVSAGTPPEAKPRTIPHLQQAVTLLLHPDLAC